MAKLSAESLTLEITFTGFEAGDVLYEIAFLFEGESMINDALLKRSSAYWSSRRPSVFPACDYEKDYLIETIEKVLETNQPEYWEPYEPDVILAIYPEMHFPFLRSHYQVIWKNSRTKEEVERRERKKLEQGKLPDDPITLICFIDAYNFRNTRTYCESGVALHLTVERKDLELFCLELKKEYAHFKEDFKPEEYKPKLVSTEAPVSKEFAEARKRHKARCRKSE
jgi:hypothetical protein